MPAARPTSAKVMNSTAAADCHFRNASTPRNWFETVVRVSASSNIGTRPIQNFDQRNALMLTGALRTTQNAEPSADTAGNTKRTATAESTKAAIARLTKA